MVRSDHSLIELLFIKNVNGSITTATFFGVWIQFVYEFELIYLLWMVLYIRNVNELQSWGMMGKLITRGVYGGNSVGKE